ncbi:MAG TPA: glutathionylspermidine synthase family protein [Candidatus Saccharimonadales bacterium]|nr:glutathionylspermidine synthase family protein [Candidatus Saccharimonadales bacterium]
MIELKTNLIYAGKNLDRSNWLDLQRRAIFEFCKWDIHSEDHDVLASFPIFLGQETAEHLNQLAERLAQETIAAEAEILQRPNLLKRLGLPRSIRKILQRDAKVQRGSAHLRVMRFDFHPTDAGWKISEVNSDVPGGFIEASGWNRLYGEQCTAINEPLSTSDIYADAIYRIVGNGGIAALVHATNFSDDRQVMQQLARCVVKRGMKVALLGPANLRWVDGLAEISTDFASGRPDLVVRFFPAEWLPHAGSDSCWKAYFRPTRIPLSNPGSAIVSQTKRLPLIWHELRTNLPTWQDLLPHTCEVEEVRGPLDDSWVLKPALGRVGEGIAIRGISTVSDFLQHERQAHHRPEEWVAQKRFAISPVNTESGIRYPCIGVFTIEGKAAGFYGRVSEQPIITHQAQDAAVLVTKRREVYAA